MRETQLAEALREIGIIATAQVPNERQLLQAVAALAGGGIRAVEFLSGLTPTEVWRAHEMAADFVKITATEAMGGPRYILSLRETLPALQVVGADMPLDGCIPYLEAGVEVLEFKSALTLPELAEREAWTEISQRALEIVNACNKWWANH